MSIATEITRLQGAKSSIKTAIENKGVTVPAAATLDTYSTYINNIGSVQDVEIKDYNFCDYDGTILYSYTKNEVNTAGFTLPPNPTHTGLTAQGWNVDYDANDNFVPRTKVHSHVFYGQNYITDDGKTRLYITIDDEDLLDVTFYFYQRRTSGLTIDWGDNSVPTISTTTGHQSTTHTYAAKGSYIISITVSPENSNYFFCGNNSNTVYVFGPTQYECSILRKVEIGSRYGSATGTTIYNYSFYRCPCLETITIPSDCTTFGNQCLYQNHKLRFVVVPTSVTSKLYCQSYSQVEHLYTPNSVTDVGTSTYVHAYMYNVKDIILSENIVNINQGHLASNFSLKKIDIPSGVTNIGVKAFQMCYSLKEIYMWPTTPPQLAADSFSSCPSDMIIYVPTASVNAYKTATNWSDRATYIQACEDLDQVSNWVNINKTWTQLNIASAPGTISYISSDYNTSSYSTDPPVIYTSDGIDISSVATVIWDSPTSVTIEVNDQTLGTITFNSGSSPTTYTWTKL